MFLLENLNSYKKPKMYQKPLQLHTTKRLHINNRFKLQVLILH